MTSPPMFNPNAHPDKTPISLEDQTSLTPSHISSIPDSRHTDSGGDLSTSPWAQMFPGGATKEELKMFISIFVKSLIAESKREDAHFIEALKRQEREREGLEP
jgi:hypothetical protein